ncbi:PAS domain S-box protein [Acidovorax sp. SUPP3334]|uniref:PAS domain S-box protein n=1 Tax=Acidovorax sp. SUPP3334 TaxID=2920881 RepID=UPI0023DE3989|nr:PAS domain S-box protein [Acidovorax sp. SUPP3334]GKT23073.1 PAS domain S-box protein [Acidovorax sp. SUPP3334]
MHTVPGPAAAGPIDDSPGTRPDALAITDFDWSQTPLGNIEHWPQSVRAALAQWTSDAAVSPLPDGDIRNRQILDSAIDYAIVAFDLDGKVTRWNEGARRVLGWTELEMLGHDAARIFTPEDRAARRMEMEMQAALTRGVGTDERWHVRKSGERFWANGEMTPIRDAEGTPIGFVKVLRDRTEQHRAAEALRLSEERLHRAQKAGGVGTFSLELATDLLYGTREFYRIFGVPEAESIPAKALEALVLPEDAHVRSARDTRSTESAPLDVEYRIRRANDGALRWVARKADFVRGPDGTIVRMVGVAQDITERKAALQAVKDSAAEFRTFAQSLPSHVWTARNDGYLDWFNDRVYEYSEAEPGSLDGDGWTRLVHPEDLAAVTALWRASVASGEQYETEFRIRRADGAMRWHLVRALPLRTESGTIKRWIGTSTDIHEQKLVQAESVRDRNRLWELSREIMLVFDLRGVIVAVNPAATRLLGWEKTQMAGHTVGEFIHPEDADNMVAELAELAGAATTLVFENRWRKHDGTYCLLSWTAVPEDGFVHAVARDVTRERTAEEALRQSQKLEAIGQLTGGVAHDFNNVLAVIRTSIDLLRRVQLTDERRYRFMESISNAVTRATKLTGQLLAFARRQALQPTVFDAGHNTRAVSEMISSLAGARIEIELKLAETACFVHADPSQFDTALVNLAVNARDAMKGSGKLTIEVRAVSEIPAQQSQPAVQGRFVAVSIIDSGTGIAPEHLTQIFEPFFTTKGVGHGTGLGLSQVFGFAKQSGGDIRVESTVGQGSRFTLYLPRAARPGYDHPSAETDDRLALGNGGCVLVVEDNAEVSASVEQTLHELGYTTVVMSSAEKALETLKAGTGRFVAVFSDVVMAGMSGIELGREIRRRYGTALPIVLSSGYSYVLAQSPDHGFTLLPKPYSLDELAQVLHDSIHGGDTPRPRRRKVRTSLPPSAAADAAQTEMLRQAELESMRILDTEEEAAFDEFARLAASFCQTPIALVSLVDSDRQWFKAKVGLPVRETPREHSFCAHAILEPESVMMVCDTSQDERFANNALVTGEPRIKFYAGAPLITSTGQALGTLCVIDRVPRELETRQVEVLQFLAAQLVERLEARRASLIDAANPAVQK